MRMIESNIKETRMECKNCDTSFAYTEYDIIKREGAWIRTGTDSSECHGVKGVKCPICHKFILLEEYIEEY